MFLFLPENWPFGMFRHILGLLGGTQNFRRKNKIKVFLLSARAHRKRVHSFMVHIEQTAWTFPPLSGKVHRITYGTAS